MYRYPYITRLLSEWPGHILSTSVSYVRDTAPATIRPLNCIVVHCRYIWWHLTVYDYLAADDPLYYLRRCYYALGHYPECYTVSPHVSSSLSFRVFPQFDSVAYKSDNH